jgi:hypothetical protein
MAEPMQIAITEAEAIAVLECTLAALRGPEGRGPCASLAKRWAGTLAKMLLDRGVIPAATADEWQRELLGGGSA